MPSLMKVASNTPDGMSAGIVTSQRRGGMVLQRIHYSDQKENHPGLYKAATLWCLALPRLQSVSNLHGQGCSPHYVKRDQVVLTELTSFGEAPFFRSSVTMSVCPC